MRIGVTKAGKITALDMRVLFDGGAYAAAKGVPWLQPGRCPKLPYAVPNARVERISVYTNTIPGAFVRAPGDVQIIFGFESLMDMIAARTAHRSVRLADAQRGRRPATSISRAIRSPGRARAKCWARCARRWAGTRRFPRDAAAASR